MSLLTAAALAAFTGRAGAQAPTEPDTTPTATIVAPPPPPAPTSTADQSTADQIGNLLFPDNVGTYPADRYKLYYGNGDLQLTAPNVPGPIDNIARAVVGNPSIQTPIPTERSATGTFLGWAVDGLRLVASIVWQFTVWLFSFGFLRMLGPLADTVTEVIDVTIVGPLRLREFVGLIVGVWLAWRLIRFDKITNVFLELLVACGLLVTSWFVVAHPGGYFNTVADLASQAAQLPFRAIAPDDPDAGLDAAAAGMKRAYVEAPWQVVNWGRETTGACAVASDRVLAEGPFGTTDDEPRKIMLDAGCQAEAKFNHEPTGMRLGMVVLIFAAAVGAMFFVGACLWAFLRGQFGLFWTVATGVRLLIGATKIGRQVAVGWFKDLADNILTIVVPAWLLAVMVMGDLALLALGDVATASSAGAAVTTVGHQVAALPVFLRLVLMAGLNWTLFAKRKQLVNQAAKFMSAKIDRASARVVRADQADVKAARAAAAKTEARDFMPDHKLVTAAAVGYAASAKHQLVTGGQRVRQVRGVAAKAAGPAGSAVTATRAGAAMVADKSKEAGHDVATAGRVASSSATDLSRRVSAGVAARRVAARHAADARAGRGTAPLGDMHGPTLADVGPVHGPPRPAVEDDLLAPGSEFDHDAPAAAGAPAGGRSAAA